ncbi:unnamed protein product, partial [Choristocarpus tenellus]
KVCLATVTQEGLRPEAVLEGGHKEQIRAFDWQDCLDGQGGGGYSIVTGGEDAKLCVWESPG